VSSLCETILQERKSQASGRPQPTRYTRKETARRAVAVEVVDVGGSEGRFVADTSTNGMPQDDSHAEVRVCYFFCMHYFRILLLLLFVLTITDLLKTGGRLFFFFLVWIKAWFLHPN
jgi:hypothetical protein